MSMFDMMPLNAETIWRTIFRELENWEKSFFGDMSSGFNTDIKDKGDHYELEADLPGMKKEDIAVDIDGDYLTISAQRNTETEEKDDKNSYVRRERSYGSFSRSFNISNIKSEEISGSYENGVLKLTLAQEEPHHRSYQPEAGHSIIYRTAFVPCNQKGALFPKGMAPLLLPKRPACPVPSI